VLAESIIHENERGHGLDQWDGSGQDAGLVTAGAIMFAPSHADAIKSTADVEAFGRGQAEHGLGEIGFEPIEHRFAPA
jgi:hypothetical protein